MKNIYLDLAQFRILAMMMLMVISSCDSTAPSMQEDSNFLDTTWDLLIIEEANGDRVEIDSFRVALRWLPSDSLWGYSYAVTEARNRPMNRFDGLYQRSGAEININPLGLTEAYEPPGTPTQRFFFLLGEMTQVELAGTTLTLSNSRNEKLYLQDQEFIDSAYR